MKNITSHTMYHTRDVFHAIIFRKFQCPFFINLSYFLAVPPIELVQGYALWHQVMSVSLPCQYFCCSNYSLGPQLLIVNSIVKKADNKRYKPAQDTCMVITKFICFCEITSSAREEKNKQRRIAIFWIALAIAGIDAVVDVWFQDLVTDPEKWVQYIYFAQ